MAYPPELLEMLQREAPLVLRRIADTQARCILEAANFQDTPTAEHLRFGVGRRLMAIRRSISKIFEVFPPTSFRPLSPDALADVQINLHAFVINLSGIFDNLAWAFKYRHNLQLGQFSVGLFKRDMLNLLPSQIRDALDNEEIRQWHLTYLKEYRDSLAHRIPMYVPPAVFRGEDGQRWNELELMERRCVLEGNLEQARATAVEKQAVGEPAFFFVHSDHEGAPSRPIMLHPQILSDAVTVLEVCDEFFASWHEMAGAG